MDFGNLSAADQQKLNAFIMKKQESEVMASYNSLTKRCFTSCVTDFTSSALGPKEETCISQCVKRFLESSERINKRFAEENMKLQQSMQ